MKKPKKGAAEKHRLALEQRRNKRYKIIGAVLLIAIAGESAFIFAKSETFNIRKVTITGEKMVGEKRILRLSGLSSTTNIFDFSAGHTRKNIESEPWIKSANVARAFPLRVNIRIIERTPAAVFQSGARYCLVDTDMTVIQIADTNIFTGVPFIKDTPYEDIAEPGDVVKSSAADNAVSVLKSLDPETAAAITAVSAPTIDGLSFTLNSGTLVMYGKAEMHKQKNYAIKVILTEAVNEGKVWQYIDVRVPANPAAKAVG